MVQFTFAEIVTHSFQTSVKLIKHRAILKKVSTWKFSRESSPQRHKPNFLITDHLFDLIITRSAKLSNYYLVLLGMLTVGGSTKHSSLSVSNSLEFFPILESLMSGPRTIFKYSESVWLQFDSFQKAHQLMKFVCTKNRDIGIFWQMHFCKSK